MSNRRLGALVLRLRSSISTRIMIALAAAAVAALAFIKVAEDVLEKETTAFDHAVSLWLHRFDSPTSDLVMRIFSFIGSVPASISVVALVGVWALRHGNRALAGGLVAVASVAEGLNVLLKMLFHRSRPELFSEIVAPASYSFPSGHAMGSVAAYGMTAIVIARLRPRLRLPLYISTPFLVLLIGVSRVFLGVHWPTDVLAGFAAGGLVLVAGVLALDRFHPARATGAA